MRVAIAFSVLFIISATVIFADAGWANSFTGLPGIANNDHPNIAMIEEEVAIVLNKNDSDVNAVFFFENNGNTESVEMFFPLLESKSQVMIDMLHEDTGYWQAMKLEHGFTPDKLVIENRYNSFDEFDYPELYPKEFSVTVDGKPVDISIINVQKLDNGGYRSISEKTSVHWTANLEAGQTHRIECSYNIIHGIFKGPYNESFDYVLYTGATWAGPIGEGIINISCNTDKAFWFKNPDPTKLQPATVSLDNNLPEVLYTFDDYEPSNNCILSFTLLSYAGEDYPVGMVTIDSLNLRTEPNNTSSRVAAKPTLAKGTEFNVISGKGEWWHIKLDNGITGWIRWRYMDPDDRSENIYAIPWSYENR